MLWHDMGLPGDSEAAKQRRYRRHAKYRGRVKIDEKKCVERGRGPEVAIGSDSDSEDDDDFEFEFDDDEYTDDDEDDEDEDENDEEYYMYLLENMRKRCGQGGYAMKRGR